MGWEKGPSLQSEAHTDPQQRPWLKSINSVFRWEMRNLFSLLFTNLDQVSNNIFFPQKWSDFWATLRSLWFPWKLLEQLPTSGPYPLTAASRFARKRKLTSYLFPNFKGIFSLTFYFLEGEGPFCNSELCGLAKPVCALKALAGMAVVLEQREPARPSLPPVAAAARCALIYSNYCNQLLWDTNGIIYVSIRLMFVAGVSNGTMKWIRKEKKQSKAEGKKESKWKVKSRLRNRLTPLVCVPKLLVYLLGFWE